MPPSVLVSQDGTKLCTVNIEEDIFLLVFMITQPLDSRSAILSVIFALQSNKAQALIDQEVWRKWSAHSVISRLEVLHSFQYKSFKACLKEIHNLELHSASICSLKPHSHMGLKSLAIHIQYSLTLYLFKKTNFLLIFTIGLWRTKVATCQ